MKSKANLESLIYAVVIALSLAALVLVATAATLFADTKLVYLGF